MHRSLITLLVPCALLPTAHAQLSGDLDSTFHADGIVTTDFGTNAGDIAWCLALQADGRIVVAGRTMAPGGPAFALARYMPDGGLDGSFGSGGLVTTTVTDATNQTLKAVAIQPDGKIVVGGSIEINGGDWQFALARYGVDGALDNSFDGDGIRMDDIGSGEIASIALQADGRIVVTGTANNDLAVVRYHPDGSLDDSFSGDGSHLLDINSSFDDGFGVAVQPDGRITVLGSTTNGDPYSEFLLVRFMPDGSFDPSFGTDGLAITSFTPETDYACAFALRPDGRIVVAGGINISSLAHMAVAQFGSDGSLDPSFGNAGLAVVDNISTLAFAVALMPDGRIVAGGTDSGDHVLVLFAPDGSLDTGFSGDGVQITPVGAFPYANGLAVQADGKILHAGGSDLGTTSIDFLVLRYLTDLNVGMLEFGDAIAATALIYPNPIGRSATLQYALRNSERISIRLMDARGRIVHTFLDATVQQAGDHRLELEFPSSIAAGSYSLVIAGSSAGQVTVEVVKE